MDNLLRGLVNWVDNWLPFTGQHQGPIRIWLQPCPFIPIQGPSGFRRCPPLPAAARRRPLIISCLRCPPALPFPFLIVPWRLNFFFASTFPLHSTHYFHPFPTRLS